MTEPAAATFPDGFLWGAATASHQVEGNNVNNHYWEWEHAPNTPFAEPSGDAVDHYHRWREDLDLLAGAGLNSYRFSLEWSRIEPEEGEVSRAALGHYRRMLDGCRDEDAQLSLRAVDRLLVGTVPVLQRSLPVVGAVRDEFDQSFP